MIQTPGNNGGYIRQCNKFQNNHRTQHQNKQETQRYSKVHSSLSCRKRLWHTMNLAQGKGNINKTEKLSEKEYHKYQKTTSNSIKAAFVTIAFPARPVAYTGLLDEVAYCFYIK
jgi:hypothetical protein